MNTSVTDALAEAATIAPSGVVILPTISVYHPSAGTIDLVQDRNPLTAQDELGQTRYYQPSSFDFTLPESSVDVRKDLNISVPNVDRIASDFLAAVPLDSEVPIIITYREYLSSLDMTQQPQSEPVAMYMSDAETTAFQVNGTASVKSLVNSNYPNELYTLERFPALN